MGSTFTVEWYFDESFYMEAKEIYDGLPDEEKQRLHQIVKYIADSPIGTIVPKTLYNLENAEHKIYALKPKDYRFFNFMAVGKKIIIINAYRKHSQQMTKKDLQLLKTAIDAKGNYLKRLKEGTYYERYSK